MKKTSLLMILILFLFAFTGCAPTVAEARSTFCQNLTNYGQSVRALQSVDATTTVDEANRARDEVAEARQELLDSSSELREAKLESAEDAWEALSGTVQNPSGEATLGEVALTIQRQATVLNAEIARLNSVICSR